MPACCSVGPCSRLPKWRERHAEDLNVLEQAFLEASVALQHQEEAQERQRLADEQAHLRALADAQRQRAEEHASAAKRLRGVVAVLCCVALVAVIAWQRANTARQGRPRDAASQYRPR